MEYSKIIEKYLIDFDKLEVGQTLWSSQYGKVTIVKIDTDSKYPVHTSLGDMYFTNQKNGKTYTYDKYPTLFTSNPFEGLQRVEPILEKCVYCQEYGNLSCDKCEYGRSKIDPTVRENRTIQNESVDSSISEQTTLEAEAERYLQEQKRYFNHRKEWEFLSTKKDFKAGAEYAQKSSKEVEKQNKELVGMLEKLIADKEKIMRWFTEGDIGASSKTMANYFVGLKDFDISYPRDRSDFGRCYKILELFPEWKLRIRELSALSIQWKNISENWSKLSKMYENKDDEFYKFIKSLNY